MKRTVFFALLAGLFCMNMPSARAQESRITVIPDGVKLSSVACNAAEASRQFTIDLGTLGPTGKAVPLVVFHIAFTYDAATVLTLACTESDDGGTTQYIPQESDMVAGLNTLYDSTWTKAVSASKNYSIRWDATGFLRAKCTFSCTGGGASDLTTIKVYKTTK